MKSFISLRNTSAKELPDEFRGEDERTADELVEILLEEYTRPGDKVIDIFAGFGTTLVVAERMDRIGYGIEIDTARFEYAKAKSNMRKTLFTETRDSSTTTHFHRWTSHCAARST